jgi:DNA-binding NtrC family response regulator
MKPIIILIELENSLRINLAQHLRLEGFEVFETDHVSEVDEYFSNIAIALTILSLEALKQEGIAMLRKIRQHFPHAKVITINSAERFDLSIECMRLGAYDDFLIPFDFEALMASVRQAMENNSDRGSKANKV